METKVLVLRDDEVRALLFAVRSDLETVENDIENFSGEDEPLRSVLAKLELL